MARCNAAFQCWSFRNKHCRNEYPASAQSSAALAACPRSYQYSAELSCTTSRSSPTASCVRCSTRAADGNRAGRLCEVFCKNGCWSFSSGMGLGSFLPASKKGKTQKGRQLFKTQTLIFNAAINSSVHSFDGINLPPPLQCMVNHAHFDKQKTEFAADVEIIKVHYADQLTGFGESVSFYKLGHTLTEVLLQSVNGRAPEDMRQGIMKAFKHRFQDFEWHCCN